MIDAEVNLTGNFALAMSNVNKFLDKYLMSINQTSVASYISDASKGKKTITTVNSIILKKLKIYLMIALWVILSMEMLIFLYLYTIK